MRTDSSSEATVSLRHLELGLSARRRRKAAARKEPRRREVQLRAAAVLLLAPHGGKEVMPCDVWLTKHRYLQPVADVHAPVEAAAGEICVSAAPVPDFAAYASDFHAGAGWTSLHLDIIARERGLKRVAASFYHPGA